MASSKIETKVAAPSAAGAVVAILALVLSHFGLDLDASQQATMLGIVVAALPIAHLLLGYLAPHTNRPDLAVTQPDAPVVVPAATTVMDGAALLDYGTDATTETTDAGADHDV